MKPNKKRTRKPSRLSEAELIALAIMEKQGTYGSYIIPDKKNTIL